AGRNMRTCLKSAHRRRIARSLTSHDEHGSPRYKPRSGSCCVFPPTKGTPVQAILPDRDGFALSYGDSCDEFPRRWQTATLLERATTRSFPDCSDRFPSHSRFRRRHISASLLLCAGPALVHWPPLGAFGFLAP